MASTSPCTAKSCPDARGCCDKEPGPCGRAFSWITSPRMGRENRRVGASRFILGSGRKW
jgi:hypothetical protein